MKKSMRLISVKITTFIILIIILIFSIEIGSYIIIKYLPNHQIGVLSDTFVFKPHNKDKDFKPNYDSVLPVQENLTYRWTTNEFDVLVNTNSKGLRENFEVEYSSIKIAFFGDSFTFGHGVNVEDRYTNVFSRISKKYKYNEVVSLSYKNGFQPEHYEFFLRNVSDLKPEKIIIGLYLGNDLYSDVLETDYDVNTNSLKLPYRLIQEKGQMAINLSELAEPWSFLSRNTNTGKFFVKVLGRTALRAYLFRGFEGPNSPNSKHIETGEVDLSKNRAMKSLLRINRLAKQRGSELNILLIPQNFYFGDENPHIHPDLKDAYELRKIRKGNNLLNSIIEFCAVKSLTCFDPSSILDRTDYFPQDAHWNVQGNFKIGTYLDQKIAATYPQ